LGIEILDERGSRASVSSILCAFYRVAHPGRRDVHRTVRRRQPGQRREAARGRGLKFGGPKPI
jgi:hypothetical protein